MKDIFYPSKDIKNIAPEHIIPAGIGGTLSSRHLLDKDTNQKFGQTIDKSLIETLNLFLCALEIQTRRGKSRTVECEDSDYDLGSGWILKQKTNVKKGDSGEILGFTTQDSDKARDLLKNFAKGGIISLDDSSSLTIFRQKSYPKKPIHSHLSFGSLEFQAIAKMAFESYAHFISHEIACSDQFNDFRAWMLQKVTSDAYDWASFDYRDDIWKMIPSLESSCFQHRIALFSGREYGGVWSAVELLGHLRFVVRLSQGSNVPNARVVYCVNPLTQEEKNGTIQICMK